MCEYNFLIKAICKQYMLSFDVRIAYSTEWLDRSRCIEVSAALLPYSHAAA